MRNRTRSLLPLFAGEGGAIGRRRRASIDGLSRRTSRRRSPTPLPVLPGEGLGVGLSERRKDGGVRNRQDPPPCPLPAKRRGGKLRPQAVTARASTACPG